MISRTHRFHGYGSLRYLYKNSQTLRGQLFSLKYVQNPRRQTYRMAVVVSKKVNKSAVVRNRIRRRIYEAVRLLEDQITQPYDLVITVFHEQVADLASEDLKNSIKEQLKQANII